MNASLRPTLDGIQILRAVAAIAVVVHHTLGNLARVAGIESPLNRLGNFEVLGAAGVDLFFVISGFIMLYVSRDEFGRDGAAARFLWRRAIRVYPLYWFYTLAIIALAATSWILRNLQMDLPYALGSLLLIPATRPGPDPTIHPILDQGWTLSYELGFYLLFAVCLRFGSARAALWLLPPVFALLVVLGHTLDPTLAAVQFLAMPLSFEFYFGLVIAWLMLNNRLPARGHRLMGLLALLLLAVGTSFAVNALLRPLAWGLPAALLVVAALGAAPACSLAARTMVALGNASYSIYLTHALGILAMSRLATGHGGTALAALGWQLATVLSCVAGGYIAYRLIERPMLAQLGRIGFSGPTRQTA